MILSEKVQFCFAFTERPNKSASLPPSFWKRGRLCERPATSLMCSSLDGVTPRFVLRSFWKWVLPFTIFWKSHLRKMVSLEEHFPVKAGLTQQILSELKDMIMQLNVMILFPTGDFEATEDMQTLTTLCREGQEFICKEVIHDLKTSYLSEQSSYAPIVQFLATPGMEYDECTFELPNHWEKTIWPEEKKKIDNYERRIVDTDAQKKVMVNVGGQVKIPLGVCMALPKVAVLQDMAHCLYAFALEQGMETDKLGSAARSWRHLQLFYTEAPFQIPVLDKDDPIRQAIDPCMVMAKEAWTNIFAAVKKNLEVLATDALTQGNMIGVQIQVYYRCVGPGSQLENTMQTMIFVNAIQVFYDIGTLRCHHILQDSFKTGIRMYFPGETQISNSFSKTRSVNCLSKTAVYKTEWDLRGERTSHACQKQGPRVGAMGSSGIPIHRSETKDGQGGFIFQYIIVYRFQII